MTTEVFSVLHSVFGMCYNCCGTAQFYLPTILALAYGQTDGTRVAKLNYENTTAAVCTSSQRALLLYDTVIKHTMPLSIIPIYEMLDITYIYDRYRLYTRAFPSVDCRYDIHIQIQE